MPELPPGCCCLQGLEEYWLFNRDFVAGNAMSIADLPIACELEQLCMLAGATQATALQSGPSALHVCMGAARRGFAPSCDEAGVHANCLCRVPAWSSSWRAFPECAAGWVGCTASWSPTGAPSMPCCTRLRKLGSGGRSGKRPSCEALVSLISRSVITRVTVCNFWRCRELGP